jgi:Ca2+-transporting ATPase
MIPLGLTYWLALRHGLPEGDARALTFVSLVLIDLALVLVNRSFSASPLNGAGKGNHALWWVSGVTLTMLTAILTWLPARTLFHLGPLHADDLGVVAAIVVSVVTLLELLKRFWRGRLIS